MDIHFSIVVPTLNEEVCLPKLLNDLGNQSFKNFDVIVVDANSKDKTQKIVKKWGAKLIVSNKKNVSYQRNLGAKNANSEWIVFMDADNRIPKNYLQKINSYLKINNPDIVSTWIRPDGRSKKDKAMALIANIFMDINKNSKKPYIFESMVIIKKASFSKLKGFDTKIPWREGEDLLERAHKIGMVFNFIKNPRYTYSFRRLNKMGAFKMLQETSQMEIIRMLKGELKKKDTTHLYPMIGGDLYKNDKKHKMTIKKFVSTLFD